MMIEAEHLFKRYGTRLVVDDLSLHVEVGDVLGFIQVNWPSYTPRATWYNLQRQYLHRQTHQLTEGRPKEDKNMKVRRRGIKKEEVN